MLMPGSTDPGLRRQSCPVPLVGNSLLGYDHRYGFNGKEGDDEVKGDDNQQDYGMRIYDPRAGRFLSVDPIAKEYPWYTPYQFAGNKPIFATDLDGLEEKPAIIFGDNNGTPVVKIPSHKTWIEQYKFDFVTSNKASYILNDAANRGASYSGALVVLAFAAVESGWGKGNGGDVLNNPFSLLGKKGISNYCTDHGCVIPYKTLEDGVNAFWNQIGRTDREWSAFSKVVKKSSISSDDINAALKSWNDYKSPGCYDCDGGTNDKGGDIIQRAILIKKIAIDNAADRIVTLKNEIQALDNDLKSIKDTKSEQYKKLSSDIASKRSEMQSFQNWKSALESTSLIDNNTPKKEVKNDRP